MSEEDVSKLLGSVKLGALADMKGSVEADPFAKMYKPDDEDKPVLIEKAYKNVKGTSQSKQYEDEGIDLYNAAECAVPPYNLDYLAKLYDASSFHATAVDAKIDNTVGLGYDYIYSHEAQALREKAEKSKTSDKLRKLDNKLEETRRDLEELVDSFNNIDELDEILVKCLKDRHTTGNGYIEIGRNTDGSIGYIGHIPSKSIRIRRGRDGFIQTVHHKNIFFRNFGDTTTPDPLNEDRKPNELIHFKFYSPIDDYYGVPEIISASQAIAGIEFAQRYNIDYFENKAVPRYIIKTKGIKLSTDQQSALLKFFETNTKGISHRTVMVPLPAGQEKDIDFHPVETGRQEASFTEFIKLNLQIILSRHRVPQGRVGMTTASTSAAESAASEKTFKETVCRPEQRLIEKKFNRVIKELTDLFVFKLREFTLTDEDQQSQIAERYLRWGVYVPDEVRTTLKLSPRADGKGGQPVDQATMAETASIAQDKAEQKAQQYENRTRDQNRNSSNPDSASNSSTRRTQGSGANPNT